MAITIELLKNYPQHISRLVQIGHEELGPTWAPKEEQLRQQLQSDLLSKTFVALDEGTPVGMCSLSKTKDIRHDLTPWLGPLFVAKQYQGRGIGSQLIEAVKQKARMLGFEKLHLCTHDFELAAGYYQRRCWKVIGVDEWKGYLVTVMKIKLLKTQG
jgi:GNAT superfamily N-acetyltransferase